MIGWEYASEQDAGHSGSFDPSGGAFGAVLPVMIQERESCRYIQQVTGVLFSVLVCTTVPVRSESRRVFERVALTALEGFDF